MNKQAIFDKVVDHLLTQGKPSMDGKGGCLYRSEDGCMCAVGVLIPDDKYTPDMEMNTSHTLLHQVKGLSISKEEAHQSYIPASFYEEKDRVFDLPLDIFNYENAILLKDLQVVHDNASKTAKYLTEDQIVTFKDWPARLREVATKHGLEYNGSR